MQQLLVRFVPSLLFLTVGLGHAQTMEEAVRPCACSTAAVRALTLQLVETQTCLFPDQFVTATAENLPGVDFTGRAIPLLQRATLDALSAARARLNRNIGISSAFRPLSDQYALYNATYREEGGRRGSLQCGCLSVAPVGTSDHQSGRAVDLNDYENVALRREMTNAGCRSIVVGDRPHFECPGQDAQNIATLAFQHLWNLNNPDEPLAEDGFCGEGTKHALGRSPANGFPIGGCRGALVAGTEACNERDDDFDGQIDEGLDCSGTCVAEAVDGAEDALFKDLPPGQFGFEEAALLRRAGITTGCQPNPLMFCPRCLTTRAQMVTFVVRALGVDLAPYRAGRTFEDVSPMSTYHPYIEAAADLGITIGCGPTTFCPDDFVTRGEAATFIVRALDWPRVEGVQFFQDVPLGYTHQSAIETLRTYCVTNGCNAENFCPEAELNRAQAAAFIARAWNLENNNQCLIEHCNGQDEDLDGRADEGLVNACGTCEATVPDEVCGNDADEDCDGRVDEDCVEQDMAPVVLPADAGMSTGRTDMSPSQAMRDAAAPPGRSDTGADRPRDDFDAALPSNLDMGAEANLVVLARGGQSGGCVQSGRGSSHRVLWFIALLGFLGTRRRI